VIGIFPNGTVVHPYQTLFYQLNLNQLCGIQPKARDALRHIQPTKFSWFFKKIHSAYPIF
jgi:hypothetical protein